MYFFVCTEELLLTACISYNNITFTPSLPPLQTPNPPLWCVEVCWAASGCLRARPPACPGVEPTTALLTGSTSTSRAAAPTCCPHLLMAPGQSTSAPSVTGQEAAVRWEMWQSPLMMKWYYYEWHIHCGSQQGANERQSGLWLCLWLCEKKSPLLEKQWWKCLHLTCLFVNVSVALCSQALKMMMGLDLVSIHHKNLTLNNLPVPNGEPRFQNGKLCSAVSKALS